MPANIRIQPAMLPNGGDPTLVNIPPSGWRWPGMIGGAFTLTVKDPDGITRSKTYQFVRTDSTMTVNPYDGAVAWWRDQATYQVTTDPTNRRGQVAGVFLNPLTKGNITAIQIGGYHANVKFIDAVTAAPTAAGLIVIPSSTAGKADCLAAGTAATYPAIGVTAGAYNGAAATGPVELRIGEPQRT